MIDVNPNHLDTITRILAEHVPECEVRAFGSRVTWTAKDYSDVDLAVVGERALDADALRHLKEAFEESDLPFRVDVLDWHAISSAFRKVIEKKYDVVQKGKQKNLGMRGEWVDTTLGDVLTLQRGFDLPETERKLGPYPVIASTGPVGTHAEAMVQGPGVVIGRSGSLGGGQFIEGDFWPLNTTLWVKDFKGNDRRFCYYLLKSLDLAHFNVGSGVPTLNRNHIHPLRLSVPIDPSEQRAIAHILGTLDDKIELNRRMNETLESMARALFKSWFVDFLPVRAKCRGTLQRAPTDADLPQPLADIFPNSFEDSELGEIPKGWKVAPLPELIEVNPSRPLGKGEIAPYLDMANMPTRGHVPDEIVDRPFGSGMRFINGDTLVARITPCLENGKTAFVDFLRDGQVGWGSTEYIVLRPKPTLPEEFAYCLARSEGFREFAIQSMTGSSGRQRVPAESLAHFQLPVAPKPIAAEFGRIVKPLFARASAAVRESRTLAALRDTLLPKLISGELRVKDAERFIGRAV